jgi:hypothetical protein
MGHPEKRPRKEKVFFFEKKKQKTFDFRIKAPSIGRDSDRIVSLRAIGGRID